MEKKLDKLMSQEEFLEAMNKAKEEHRAKVIQDFAEGTLSIRVYNGVTKFKSVRRAIRRGHVDLFTGVIYPRRPFNNRKRTSGRNLEMIKENIYATIKKRRVQ